MEGWHGNCSSSSSFLGSIWTVLYVVLNIFFIPSTQLLAVSLSTRAMDDDKESVRQLVDGLGLTNFHQALEKAFDFTEKKKSLGNLRRLKDRFTEASQVCIKADEEKQSAEWNPATRAYFNAMVAPLWTLLESSRHLLYEYNFDETLELPRVLTPSPSTRQQTPSFGYL